MNILDKDYKMKVTPEQSRAVQEACFARDIEWHGGAAKAVKYTDKPYLYIHRWEGITFGGEGEEEFLKAEEFCLVEPESFIAMMNNKPKGHPHAELMAQYAQDAAETKTPWERWEFFIASDEYGDDRWVTCGKPLAWIPTMQYRQKVNDVELSHNLDFPNPIQIVPKHGTSYWYLDWYDNRFTVQSTVWISHETDFKRLRARVCHLNREEAEHHVAVLNAIYH